MANDTRNTTLKADALQYGTPLQRQVPQSYRPNNNNNNRSSNFSNAASAGRNTPNLMMQQQQQQQQQVHGQVGAGEVTEDPWMAHSNRSKGARGQHASGHAEAMIQNHANNHNNAHKGHPNSAPSSRDNSNSKINSNSNARADDKPNAIHKLMAAAVPRIQEFVPGPVPICPVAACHWIYPKDCEQFPTRQYQLEMTEKALFYNTLVSLPTGLGKTLIAAVVMYNYYRWFPDGGKVIFMAPTLPLVHQQVKACFDIMGFSEEDTAVLTGRIHVTKRKQLWESRRLFYCTPQTVQKDIDSKTFPDPSKVVCIVLDEAHKASGEYSYTKVIEQLDFCCAKYRILGLSATPGTTIKAIQSVVNALRITKIEARTDEEPSVRPYVHDRQTEIVLVQHCSMQHELEKDLIGLLKPILDSLREDGALNPARFGGYKLSGFQIHKAREMFLKDLGGRHFDPSSKGRIIGSFHAAYTLANIRDKLQQSVGVVRTMLVKLKNLPQKGILSTIVKSAAYQQMLDKLRREQDSSNLNSNSPKLIKLSEILIEHFERARACGKSSRAIVFAQFRDSVSEIAHVLTRAEPMIRPRHFVGQGKGATTTLNKKKNNNDKTANTTSPKKNKAKDADVLVDEEDDEEDHGDETTSVPLKGMKQREQQQVIREFQDNVFNVLVCTCIGEEGLDIGEVDLIVNYDCLRSPIRMIQRTGRTGRKRDGRVVCLVAEGQEQRTHDSSKQAEKTLHRALKDNSKFTLSVNEPMFEVPPERKDMEMSIGTQFHLSQVGGHVKQRDPVGIGGIGGDKLQRAGGDWKLTAAQERIRQRICGSIEEVLPRGVVVAWPPSSRGFPVSLRRLVLRARLLSKSRLVQASTKRQKGTAGRSVAILRRLEELSGENIAVTAKSARARVRTSSGGRHDLFHRLFPLEPVESLNDFRRGVGSDCDEQDSEDDQDLSAMMVGNNTKSGMHVVRQAPVPVASSEAQPGINHMALVAPSTTVHQGDVDDPNEKQYKRDDYREAQQRFSTSTSLMGSPPGVVTPFQPPLMSHVLLGVNADSSRPLPPSDCALASRDTNALEDPGMSRHMPAGPRAPHGTASFPCTSFGFHHTTWTPPVELVTYDNGRTHHEVALSEVIVDRLPDIPVFRLPTPPPSSSSSSSSSSESDGDQSHNEDCTSSVPNIVAIANPGLPVLELGQAWADVAAGLGYVDPVEPDMRMHDTGGIPSVNETVAAACHQETETPFVIRLPTQDSSSSEEGSVATEISQQKEFPPQIVWGNNLEARQGSNEDAETSDDEEDIPLASLRMEKAQQTLKLLDQNSSESNNYLASIESAEGQSSANHNPFRSGQEAFVQLSSELECPSMSKSFMSREEMAAIPSTPEPRACTDDPRIPCAYELDDTFEVESMVNGPLGGTQVASPDFLAVRPNRKRRNHAILDDESHEPFVPDTDMASARQNTSEMAKPKDNRELELIDTPTVSTESRYPAAACVKNATEALGVFYTESPEPVAGAIYPVVKCQEIEGTPFSGGTNELVDTPEEKSQESVVVRPSRQRRDFVFLDDESSEIFEHGEGHTMKTPLPVHCKDLVDSPTPDYHEINACVGNVALHDTPIFEQLSSSVDCRSDEIVCAICFSAESPDDNPIVLCDGSCNFGFHKSCYSIDVDLESEEIWRCDLCEVNHNQSMIGSLKFKSVIKCTYCSKGDGALKLQHGSWHHPYCEQFSSAVVDDTVTCDSCLTKGAIQCLGCTSAAHAHCAIHDKKLGNWTLISVGGISMEDQKECAMFCPEHSDLANHFSSLHADKKGRDGSIPKLFLLSNLGASLISDAPGEYKRLKKKRRPDKKSEKTSRTSWGHVGSNIVEEVANKRQRLERRRAVMSRFVDSEAKINSDDDMDGDEEEEEELRRLEEDERSNSSFINDSLNLTQCFTQDELAQVDPDAGPQQGEDVVHRALDAERERQTMFKTPVLNRRRQEATPEDAPSSQKGLGNMHFIRSVLEHHRNGGRAEEIEAFFHQVERSAGSNSQASTPVASAPPIQPIPTQHSPSGETPPLEPQTTPAGATARRDAASDPNAGGLTDEQRARIERNRLAALERRKQLLR
jgi:ERCC4-related helicase